LPTAYDVDANALVERLAKHLKENIGEIAPPTWALTSKTSAHRERPPQNPDWWYVRCASLLRKLYIHGPVGIQRLRVEYGGRKRKGTSIEHVKDSGGSAIREPLQQLEKAGLVAKEGLKGRKLSGEGVSLLNRVSGEILKGGSSGEGSKQ
jgi:small subunit ribosomal protein S19e